MVVKAPILATRGPVPAPRANVLFENVGYDISNLFPAAAGVKRTVVDRAAQVLNVRDFGATGNGSTNDQPYIQACFDAAFGPASNPHSGAGDVGSALYTNKAVFIPAGQYKLMAPLLLTQVNGGHIFGAGRGCSVLSLQSGNPADAVIRTDCCSYSTFAHFSCSIASAQAGTAFDLDMVNANQYVNLQSNTFFDMNFGCGDYGVQVNKSNVGGSQGSENTWIGCYFTGRPAPATSVGLHVIGQNACMNTVYGGNFGNCDKAIYCQGGEVTVVNGVSFQSNKGAGAWDIYQINGNPTNFSIAGCRSESVDFVWIQGGLVGVHMGGNWQWGTGGISLYTDGNAVVDACHLGGTVAAAALSVHSCAFQLTNPWGGQGQIVEWSSAPPAAGPFGLGTKFNVASLFTPAMGLLGLKLYVADADPASSTFGNVVAPAPTIASFTGQISDPSGTQAGSQLSVASGGTGMAIGQQVRGPNVFPGTYIVNGSGAAWNVQPNQFTPAGTAMTTAATNVVPVICDGTHWRVG